MVITSSTSHQKKEEKIDIMLLYHITISDDDQEELIIKKDIEEAPSIFKEENKFLSNWDGLYIIQEVDFNRAYKIVDKDGVRVRPINGKFLK